VSCGRSRLWSEEEQVRRTADEMPSKAKPVHAWQRFCSIWPPLAVPGCRHCRLKRSVELRGAVLSQHCRSGSVGESYSSHASRQRLSDEPVQKGRSSGVVGCVSL
jgi:hypothetical protein